MPTFDARDILQWPQGDNVTDTLIGGVHFNQTALERWNYTLYSNGTLSNGTDGWCILTFPPFEPSYVFPNGSFINSTSCYSPIKPISTRGYISIALAVAYGIALMFTLINLARHGRMYLPTEKRFRPVGRRWQWYWMITMCATAFVSLIIGIDIDRYYLPQIPIVVSSFFWMLLNLCTMACVWEAVRHWGSWMERQYIDPDPFALAMDDKRAKFEFWVPLVFYFWWWLDFFMVIPRSWGNIEHQRTPEQTRSDAAPTATDGRFKAAAFMLFVCWLIIVYHLRHSIKHYRERNRGYINRAIGLIKYTPYRFQLIVPIALFVVAFQALSAWEFEYSVFNVNGNYISIFVGGYAPALLIMLVQIIAGFGNPNEDKELIRQRRVRGAAADRELGIVNKPAWWKRLNGSHEGESMRDRIARNVREVGGGRVTAANIDRSIDNRVRESEAAAAASEVEMGQLNRSVSGAGPRKPVAAPYPGRSDARRSEHAVQNAASVLFPNADSPSMTPTERSSYLMSDGPPPPPYQGNTDQEQDRGRTQSNESGRGNNNTSVRPRHATAERSTSANTTNSIASPPQQVRSMLDV